ncbi:MAG: hypothetical protein M3511_06255 [Deinococcota bacterium]|jgi:hypothetical protein|nr:hypothetical protein [Deinococcota bacterium]
MPNRRPDTRNLTRGKGRALEALGVEALGQGEISKPVRVRAPLRVHMHLKNMTAREIGELLERAIG